MLRRRVQFVRGSFLCVNALVFSPQQRMDSRTGAFPRPNRPYGPDLDWVNKNNNNNTFVSLRVSRLTPFSRFRSLFTSAAAAAYVGVSIRLFVHPSIHLSFCLSLHPSIGSLFVVSTPSFCRIFFFSFSRKRLLQIIRRAFWRGSLII